MPLRPLFLAIVLLLAAGCAGRSRGGTPAPGGASDPSYQALPDTLICVVDRTTERGLRNLSAKRGPGDQVLLRVGGRTLPLEEVHPVRLLAGYAGNERWVTAGETLTLDGRAYRPVGGERRIGLEQLQQGGEYRALPVFADPNDTPPLDAVYLPARPGCVFRAYVREDLLGD